MHPARSLIVFTILSGCGLGALAFLAVGLPSLTGAAAFIGYGTGLALTVTGLLSSLFHLGHPERALKAFSQWRSSWLSREACLAVATLAGMTVHGAAAAFWGERWTGLGLAAAALAVCTVFATSMIYASLASVPRWNHWTTPALFVVYALSGGAMIANHTVGALVFLAAAGILQPLAWRRGDRALADSGSSIATATGLGSRGSVRAFSHPHTGPNYLTREMMFVVARRRVKALRLTAGAAGIVLPAAALFAGQAWLAVVFHMVGLIAQRWLFFAEAEHVVGLYYGRDVRP